MASVSSLSSGSSIYGSRNSHIISGLASGMDTESMIEGMVQGIKSKIDKQKQQKTILGWQQQAYRSISDQLVSLSTKYTSYTSSTNLMSQDFFKPSIITALGKYASSISASGSTSSNIEIFQASKAQTESISFTGLNGVANSSSNSVVGKFEQGADIGIDIVNGTGEDISAFEGKYITFEYNNKTYTIDLPADPTTLGTKEDGTQYSYDSAKDVADVINKQLSEIKVGESDKLSDYIQVGTNDKGTASDTSDDVIEISLTDKASGNFEITGGSSEALEGLGLEKGDKISSSATDKKLTGDTFSTTVQKDIKDILIGSTITLNYNGQSEVIAFPNKAEYEEILKAGDGLSGVDKSNAVNKAFEDFLQKKIDKAFGYGRIDVTNTLEGDRSGLFNLGFELKGSNANNDTLSITSGSTGLVGSSSIFGFDFGASNRINANDTLAELGIKLDGMNAVKGVGTPTLQDDGKTYKDDNGNIVDKDGNRLDAKGNKIYALNINGVEIGQYTQDSKLSTIMSDINNSDAGVKVTYSSTTNQFAFTASNGGSGGRVEINNDNNNNLAAAIFGSVTYDSNTGDMTVKTKDSTVTVNKDGTAQGDTGSINVTRGKDASITAIINGVEKTLTSGTNAFTIDGLAITVNSEFAIEKKDGKYSESGVTFNQSVDTDKIVNAVKTFVEEYNKMLADLGTAYTTQPSNKYAPLTDDQKADMTEKQIEEYEKKAKEGILFADSDLKSLASDLRFLFSDSALEEIGIKTSTEASDRGKLSIDENKLRAAIEGNLDSVKDAFAAPIDEKGVNGGAMPKLKQVLDKYAATTGAVKGILIEKAGSQFSPSALLNNQIKSEIEDIDEIIDKLTDQLNDKIDFYTSKFSKLEVLISQMNSQSSYLSSMSGGY